MKKKIIVLFLLICVVFLYSCKRDGRPASGSEGHLIENNEHHSTVSDSAEDSAAKQGFCLAVNAGFYIMSGEDTGDEKTKAKWSASIALGERVLLGNTRKMLFEGDNRVYDFTEVHRLSNNTKGYTLAWQVVPAGQLAVVIGENVNLYRTARIVDVSGVILTRGSVIVYYPETETDGFVQVKGYDIGRRQYIAENNSFVRYDTFSLRESDVQSSILYLTAQSLTRDNQASQREALLKSALDYYSDSVFYDEIFRITFPDAFNSYEHEPVNHENESEYTEEH